MHGLSCCVKRVEQAICFIMPTHRKLFAEMSIFSINSDCKRSAHLMILSVTLQLATNGGNILFSSSVVVSETSFHTCGILSCVKKGWGHLLIFCSWESMLFVSVSSLTLFVGWDEGRLASQKKSLKEVAQVPLFLEIFFWTDGGNRLRGKWLTHHF